VGTSGSCILWYPVFPERPLKPLITTNVWVKKPTRTNKAEYGKFPKEFVLLRFMMYVKKKSATIDSINIPGKKISSVLFVHHFDYIQTK
jgi:hypothetical protein